MQKTYPPMFFTSSDRSDPFASVELPQEYINSLKSLRSAPSRDSPLRTAGGETSSSTGKFAHMLSDLSPSLPPSLGRILLSGQEGSSLNLPDAFGRFLEGVIDEEQFERFGRRSYFRMVRFWLYLFPRGAAGGPEEEEDLISFRSKLTSSSSEDSFLRPLVENWERDVARKTLFLFCDPGTLCQLQLSCKLFRKTIHSSEFWLDYYRAYFHIDPLLNPKPEMGRPQMLFVQDSVLQQCAKMTPQYLDSEILGHSGNEAIPFRLLNAMTHFLETFNGIMAEKIKQHNPTELFLLKEENAYLVKIHRNCCKHVFPGLKKLLCYSMTLLEQIAAVRFLACYADGLSGLFPYMVVPQLTDDQKQIRDELLEPLLDPDVLRVLFFLAGNFPDLGQRMVAQWLHCPTKEGTVMLPEYVRHAFRMMLPSYVDDEHAESEAYLKPENPKIRIEGVGAAMGKASMDALTTLARLILVAPFKVVDFLSEIGFYTVGGSNIFVDRMMSTLNVDAPMTPAEFRMMPDSPGTTFPKWQCYWGDFWQFGLLHPEIWDDFFSDPERTKAFFWVQLGRQMLLRLFWLSNKMQQTRPDLYVRLSESHPLFGVMQDPKTVDVRRGKKLASQALRTVQQGQLEIALELFESSLDCFAVNSKLRRGRILSNMSGLSLRLNRPFQALEYALLAYNLLQEDNKTLSRFNDALKAVPGSEEQYCHSFCQHLKFDLVMAFHHPSGSVLMKKVVRRNFAARVGIEFEVLESDESREVEDGGGSARNSQMMLSRFPFIGKSGAVIVG